MTGQVKQSEVIQKVLAEEDAQLKNSGQEVRPRSPSKLSTPANFPGMFSHSATKMNSSTDEVDIEKKFKEIAVKVIAYNDNEKTLQALTGEPREILNDNISDILGDIKKNGLKGLTGKQINDLLDECAKTENYLSSLVLSVHKEYLNNMLAQIFTPQPGF